MQITLSRSVAILWIILVGDMEQPDPHTEVGKPRSWLLWDIVQGSGSDHCV